MERETRSHFGSRTTLPVVLGSPQALGWDPLKVRLTGNFSAPSISIPLLRLAGAFCISALSSLPWLSGIIEQQVLLPEKSRTLSAETLRASVPPGFRLRPLSLLR